MGAVNVVKSTQEQAVASWINYLNQIRIDRFMEALSKEEENLESAIETINQALKTIREDIVFNGMGRGGENGMHGFIAEIAECGIGNARSQIDGEQALYKWINDNGPEDLRRGLTPIQQKFVQSGNHLSLQAVKSHFEKYPNFLEKGGKYQIPSDHFERIEWLLSIPKEEADKMPTATGEFSLKQWQEVHDFYNSGEIPIESLEPSILDYKDVQKNTYENTFEKETEQLKKRNQERKDAVYAKSKPSLQEGAKATIVGAAAEGGIALGLAVAEKRKSGKKIKDFDVNDWKEIGGDFCIGTVKGGTRGATIYTLTNYTATPAAVASAIVTASFGVAEQANKYRKGELDETVFIENSEILCLDAAISALSSFLGQAVIPVPVLGAIIGNAVGSVMCQIAKDNLSEAEQKIIQEYVDSIRQLEAELNEQYQNCINLVKAYMEQFMLLLEKAFSPDVSIAFEGSVKLARELGVSDDEILDTKEKVDAFFMN